MVNTTWRPAHQQYEAVYNGTTDYSNVYSGSAQNSLPADQTQDSRQQRQKGQRQYNWKPVPLRAPPLAIFGLILLLCIGLIEVLLRNTSSSATNSTSISTSSSTSSALAARATPRFRPKRHAEAPAITARQESLDDCGNAADLPGEIASYKASQSSLCSVFTASYKAHTANLSWAEQTAVSQWLVDYSSVSLSSRAASGSSVNCASLATAGTSTSKFYAIEGTYTTTVDNLCSTVVTTLDWNVCYIVVFASIEGFALKSAISTVCAVSSGAVIYETTPDDPATKTSGVSINNVITPVTPVNTLPTVTIGGGATVTPADTPKQTLPTVTNPGTVVGNENIATPQSVTPAATSPAVTVAAVPIPVTYTTTDANGQVQAVVTSVNAVPGSDATVVVTNSQGVAETITAQVAAGGGQSASVVMTDSSGAVETIVANVNDLTPTTSTYVTTDSLGQVHTMSSVVYALAGSYSTYVTTGADGVRQTAISKQSQSSLTTTTQYTSLITTTNADGSVSSYSAVVVQTIVVAATKTSTSYYSKATGPTNFTLSSHEQIVEQKYSRTQYFMAMYLPAVVAVLIKALWEMVFNAIKLMEPFDRLTGRSGSSAQYTLFAEYLSSGISLDAVTSLGHSNPLPLLAGLLYLLVQVGAPLASASMTIRSRSTCLIDGQNYRCDPVWVINVMLLRAVEAVLGLGFLLILVVLWVSHRRRSGINADPSSLASIASLTNHEQLVHDIYEVGPDASHEEYENALDQHSLLLDYHKTSDGAYLYGILGLRDGSNPDIPELGDRSLSFPSDTTRQHNYRQVENPATKSMPSSYSSTTFRSKLRKNIVTDVLGLLLPLSLLAIVVAFLLDNNNDIFNNFFNSRSPWPKILLVTMATLTSMLLSRLERLVRITEPFRRLAVQKSSRDSKSPNEYDPLASSSSRNPSTNPETTLLITRSGTAYSNIPQCILLIFKSFTENFNMSFQLLISLTVLASDINILVVAGVAYSDALIWAAYQFSIKATIILTSFIILVQIVVLVWWRQTPAVYALSGRSISKGVGTIGGTMRWLLSGGTDALEAIVRVREEHEVTKIWRRHSREWGSGGGTRIWFGKTGEIGVNGQQRWALMMDPARGTRREARQSGNWDRRSNVRSMQSVDGNWF